VRYRPALSGACKKITYEDFTVIDKAVGLSGFQRTEQPFHGDLIRQKTLEYKHKNVSRDYKSFNAAWNIWIMDF